MSQSAVASTPEDQVSSLMQQVRARVRVRVRARHRVCARVHIPLSSLRWRLLQRLRTRSRPSCSRCVRECACVRGIVCVLVCTFP